MNAKLARLRASMVRLPVGIALDASSDATDSPAAAALTALTAKIQGRFFRGQARSGTEFVAHTRPSKWTRGIVKKIRAMGRAARVMSTGKFDDAN